MADDWSQFPDAGQDQWSQFPDSSSAKYIPVPVQNYGDDEEIYDENTGTTFKSPSGSGEMVKKVLSDTTFDKRETYITQTPTKPGEPMRLTIGVKPSNYAEGGSLYGTDVSNEPTTVLEETSAQAEKAMANMALVFMANDLIPREEAAQFIADKSKALSYAQQNQPEYVRDFFDKWNNSGVFGKAAAVFSNPAAVGRGVITQSPHSVVPLLMTWAGAEAGAVGGGIAGTALAPGAGTVVGASVGGTVGMLSGAYSGSKMSGTAETLDEILVSDYGVDMTNSASILSFFSDPEKVNGAKIRAERAGANMALVDTAFQLFGGRFLKMFKDAGKIKKIAAGAADVSVQMGGETIGEAARQAGGGEEDGWIGSYDRINWDDALYEGLTSGVQATGEVAIGATREAIKGGSQQQPPQPEVTIDTPEVAQVIAAPVQDVPAQESAKIVTDFLEGREVDISNYDEAKQKAILGVLERAKAAQPAIIKGRVKKLDTDIEATLNRLDAVEREIEIAKSEGKPIKQLRNQAKKLADQWMAMDEERGGLLTVEDTVSETVDTVGKDITVKGTDLVRLEKRVTQESLRAVNKAFREARTATKRDVRSTQKTLIEAIRESGLTKEDQASFINTISATQTQEQLTKKAPAIQQKIEQKLNNRLRKDTTTKINKLLSRLKKTNVVAVDYIKNIEKMVKAYDLKGMTDAKRSELEATAKYLSDNPAAAIPKSVIKKLERLAKTRSEDIATQDLIDLYDDMKSQVELGATKLRLMKKQKERRFKQRLEELRVDAKPLTTTPLIGAPLDRKLSMLEQVKNKYITARNASYKIGVNKNPMDVIFDIMDGSKKYSGAHSRIFKQQVDRSFGKYLTLAEQTKRDVKALADEIKLNDLNYRRIGVYAVAQQENGKSKLRDTGYSEAEIDSVVLSEKELKMYSLMREKLDSLLPALKETMRVVYNKDVEAVQDYFPFLTDFSKMEDMQVQDRIGATVDFTPKQKNISKNQTISRTGGKQAVRIDAMNVFLSHVDNTAYLIEMGQTVKELGDLAQSKEYGEIAGDFGQQIAVDWIDLLARKGGTENKIAWLDTLRRNTGLAMLGFKLSTVLVQSTALLDGAAMIGGNWVSRGTGAVASKEWRAFLSENFPEVKNRVGDDPAYMTMGGGIIPDNVKEWSMLGVKTLDNMVASSVAAGAYMKFLKENKLELDFSKPNAEGVAYAQLMMRRSQSSAFAKDTAPVISQGKLTGDASWDKLLLQFQSFLFNRWSMIEHDMVRAGFARGRTVESLNIAAFLLLSVATEEAIRMGLRSLFGEEEDDREITEKVAMKAVSQVPFISSLVSSMEYGSVPVPAISMGSKVFKEAAYAWQSEDDDKKIEHIGKASLAGAGIAFGMPGTMQLNQLYNSLWREEERKGGRR